MGWKLKVLAFLFGLFAIGAGAFVLAIPAFVWVFWPRNRGAKGEVGPRERKVHPVKGGSRLKYLGLLFLFLSVVALASGGTVSPLVFGALGIGLVFYGRGNGGGLPPWLTAVNGTIMLRSKVLPFSWVSVVEVKASSMDAAKVLPLVNERLLVKVGGNASVFAALHVSALSVHEAEEKVVARMRELSRPLLPVGAYVMPMKCEDAFSLVKRPGMKVKLDVDNVEHSLASAPYDILAIQSRGHLVKALGAYQTLEEGKSISVAATGQALKLPVLVWEAATAIEGRARWAPPDDVTTFLSSLAATRGANVGERLVDSGSEQGAKTVLVRSLSTPAVELSRAQLRALVRVYS